MKFINLKWDMTYNCNLRCKHCLNIKTREGKKDISYDQTISALKTLNNTGLVSHIQFLGGEPTVHAHFGEIVTALHEMGITVGINTNCIKLGRVEKSIEQFHEINVSMEGPTKETHEYIRGLDQFSTFERVFTNLKRLQALREENGHTFNLIISCVLSKHNLSVIEDMVDIAVDVGANGLNLLQLVEEGNAAENELYTTVEEKMDAAARIAVRFNDFGLTKDDLNVNMRFMYNKVIDYLQKEYAPNLPYTNHSCGAGISFAYMNQNMELYPCDRICPDYPFIESNKQIPRKSLVNTDFYEIWESDIYNKSFELQYSEEAFESCIPCKDCEYLQKQCVPCPAQVGSFPQTVIEECLKLEDMS